MRVYLIKADRVVIVRQHPSKLTEGELAVASLENLRDADLTGKQLLSLWNGLPGPEKLSKVGNRERLLHRLWARFEALPDSKSILHQKPLSKQAAVIAMLRRAKGATVDEMIAATGWQRHSVRGFISGALKKKLGLTINSTNEQRGRTYRIVEASSSSETRSEARTRGGR